jgi:hypothetical protein
MDFVSIPYTTFGGMAPAFVVILITLLTAKFLSYIIKAIGLYTIAKNEGRDYPWLAFIPIVRRYLQGQVAGPIHFKHRSILHTGVWYLVLPMIGAVISNIFVFIIGYTLASQLPWIYYNYSFAFWYGIVGMLILMIAICIEGLYSIAYEIFYVLMNKQIFERVTTSNMAILHSMLCVFVPFYESIAFFILRNHRGFRLGKKEKDTIAWIAPIMPETPVKVEEEEEQQQTVIYMPPVPSEEEKKPEQESENE